MLCLYCQSEFIRKNGQNYCNEKCKLMFHVKIENECWVWQGALSNSGYGKINISGKHLSTHRLSYEVFKGPIPKGKIICHNCPGRDNKACVNPDHLWLGTAKENYRDAAKKGQINIIRGNKWSKETREKMKSRPHADRRGEKHHLRKLTNEDVYEIRELLKTHVIQGKIAEKYGVHQSIISHIKNKKYWSHI